MPRVSDDQVHQLRFACVSIMSQPVAESVVVQGLVQSLKTAQGKEPTEDTSVPQETFHDPIMKQIKEYVATHPDPFDSVLRQFLYLATDQMYLDDAQLQALAEFIVANIPQAIEID